ncbi:MULTISPECIES: DUF3247 family protein [Stenotrophomonas]|jgi:hypothetical protein|uniref:DUF3247 family protein n=1 Tax=Stenotrophomonas aracearum TaxID=3003272 RepID=A0ABY9YEY5_9GAMM|nr:MULTISPECIES: DUF3247 family protein [unclassified Stenotrophomonas]WNH49252.1 DUF3247 family protein [Stenotrophomonas sp. A5588]
MSRYAPTIHTHQADIAALEALLPQLKGQTQVEVTLKDGTRVSGTVAVQPTVQQYRDADENEGTNGELRLDDLNDPAQQHLLWLDQIASVSELPPHP